MFDIRAHQLFVGVIKNIDYKYSSISDKASGAPGKYEEINNIENRECNET